MPGYLCMPQCPDMAPGCVGTLDLVQGSSCTCSAADCCICLRSDRFAEPLCPEDTLSLTVQVIPAGGTAKFPITLEASKVQHYNQVVEYFVNGCQIFTFQVLISFRSTAQQLAAAL